MPLHRIKSSTGHDHYHIITAMMVRKERNVFTCGVVIIMASPGELYLWPCPLVATEQLASLYGNASWLIVARQCF